MIYGQKTRLRAITSQDLPKLVEWRNDPDVNSLIGGWFFPVSLEDEKIWLERSRSDNLTKRLAIEVLDDNQYIGNVGLYDIDWKNRKAEFAILIGEKSAWGKGYGVDAANALLRFAFCQINMHRIFLHVLAHHTRAIRLYEKVGFKLEGTLREDNFRDSQYKDTLVMAILDSEFKAKIGNGN